MDLASDRLKELWCAPCVLTITGLALYWPMFRRPFLGSIFTQVAPELYGALFFFQVIAVVVGFMLAMAPEALARLVERPTPLAVASSALMFASALYIQLAGDQCVAGLLAVSTLFLVVGFAGVGFLCATVCHQLGKAAPCALVLSFLASFLVGMVELVPEGARWASALLPVLCTGCLLLARRGLRARNAECAADAGAADAGETDAGAADASAADDDFRGRWVRVLGPYTIALILVTMLAGVFTRSSWLFHAVGYNPSLRGLLTYLCSVAIATIMAALFLRARNTRTAFLTCLALLLCAVLTGVIACAVTEGRVGGRLVTSAYTCAQFCLWMFLVLRAGSATEMVSSVGFFLCIDQTCSLLMNYCIPGMLGIDTESATGYLMPLGLAGTSAISVAALVIAAVAFVRLSSTGRLVQPDIAERLGSPHAADAMRAVAATAAEAGGNAPLDGMLRQATSTHTSTPPLTSSPLAATTNPDHLAARFGLTAREAEVALCLAQGNSVKRTAEKLYIAPSTVQSFSKSIYRKMDIHSKQELIDAFAESA